MIDPFQKIPTRVIFARLMVFILPLILAGMFVAGIIGSNLSLRDALPKSYQTLVPNPEREDGPILGSLKFYALLGNHIVSPPSICVGGAMSAFQKQQCARFWNRLFLRIFIGVAPLLLALLTILLFMDYVRQVYRAASRKLSQPTKSFFIGVVTDPPIGRGDRFSWFFGLQAITVQDGEGEQMQVYSPLHAPIPLPGQKLSITSWGKHFKQKRYFGTLHAPNMAVFEGAIED